METSLHAQDPGRYHLHAYLLWTDGVGMRTRSTEPFHFKGVRPRIDVCRSRTATTSPYAAACHGLWYVVVHKAGTIHSDTNYPAGVWYKPKATWLQSLYQDKNMDHDAYLAMSARDFGPFGTQEGCRRSVQRCAKTCRELFGAGGAAGSTCSRCVQRPQTVPASQSISSLL